MVAHWRRIVTATLTQNKNHHQPRIHPLDMILVTFPAQVAGLYRSMEESKQLPLSVSMDLEALVSGCYLLKEPSYQPHLLYRKVYSI